MKVLACAIACAAGLSGCGHTESEMRIQKNRIDRLMRDVQHVEDLNAKLIARVREVQLAHLETTQQLDACRGTSQAATSSPDAPSSVVPQRDIAKFEGSGVMTTRPFAASGPWELTWAARGQDAYRFWVELHSAEGQLLDIIVSHEGDGAGETYYPRGGTFYLTVHGRSAWGAVIRHAGTSK